MTAPWPFAPLPAGGYSSVIIDPPWRWAGAPHREAVCRAEGSAMSRALTPEQRNDIVRRYRKGDPIKVIAADFGTYAAFVSELAHRRGCPRRYPFHRGLLTVRLRPQELDALKRMSAEQHVKPETIAREAIAAYLGASDA